MRWNVYLDLFIFLTNLSHHCNLEIITFNTKFGSKLHDKNTGRHPNEKTKHSNQNDKFVMLLFTVDQSIK